MDKEKYNDIEYIKERIDKIRSKINEKGIHPLTRKTMAEELIKLRELTNFN